MKEIWKKCCYGYCKVSNLGRVKCIIRFSKRSHSIGLIEPCGNKHSYRRLYICNECFLVHRLVAEAFIGPCPKGKEVNHKDLDKGNNRWDNLEYKTHAKNIKHAVSNGVKFNPHPLKGEHSPVAKLTWKSVRKIRRLYYTHIKNNYSNTKRKLTFDDLAAMCHVSNSSIQAVVYNRIWCV